MDNRWYTSLIMILAFVVLGLSTALFGPAVPDLAFNTNSSIKQYTNIFWCRAIGFLIGVLISGKTVDHYDQMALIGKVCNHWSLSPIHPFVNIPALRL
jgi:MFS family permease